MSNYTKTTNFAAKDSLPSGNAAKIVKGTEIDTEFNNIETASATKADSNNSTLTGTTAFETLSDGSISITAFVDEDNMASDSATLLPTQQSVKAYVDSQVTAQDLDFQADTGGALSIDLDSETLTFTGGTGVDTSGSGNAVTFAIDSTVATLTGSQTLSNKTLSTPVVSGNLTTDGLIDGRDVATDGTKLDGIESGATADQTAAEIKTAYESNADTNAFTDADHSKLDGIEASADVTDTANVTAAGALMDSELTSEASVKAMNQGVATTDSPTFAGVTAPITGNVTGNLTGNVTGNVTGNLTGDVTGDVTGNVTGNLTGSVLTAAQTSITSVGTLGSLTVSGDVTVDTNSLKVDSTNNRVGILNASPDVTLDIGSATDSIHIPVGTTAQRPGSPAAGYFRYNSTLSQFEGYTDAWGAIGGGGGSNLVVDTMTGDGSDTTLTLSNDPLNENNTQVYIDGVYQNKDTYSVSGTTLTFSTAPPSGSAVEAMTIQPTAVNVPADASVTSAKLSGDLVTPGALDVTGNVTADGLTVQTTNGLNALLESTTSYQYLQFKNSAETNNFIGFVSDDFVVTPANNQKLIVTAEGSVGIGTSSLTEKLEVNGSINATNQSANFATGAYRFFADIVDASKIARIGTASGANTPSGTQGELTFIVNNTERLRINSGGYVNPNANVATINAPDTQGLHFGWNYSNGAGESLIVFNKGAGTTGGLTFVDNSSSGTHDEIMRLEGGNLLVGTTTTGSYTDGKLSVFGDGSVPAATFKNAGNTGQFCANFWNAAGSGTRTLINFTTNASPSVVGSISTNGSTTAYNTSSDYRLKENIADADDAGSKVDAIQVRKFDWIADGAHQDYGMVAQELQTVAPEAVSAPEDPEEMMGVDYSKLVPMLVKEIQSLRARVQQLENN